MAAPEAEPQSLGAMLVEVCGRRGDAVALLVPEKSAYREVSYRELLRLASCFALALQARGLGAGDRFALIAENSAGWALTDWGAQLLGAVPVPIYPTLPAEQAQYIARDSGAVLVVGGDAGQVAKCPQLRGVLLSDLAEQAAGLDPGDAPVAEWIAGQSAGDLATLIYTSGTTGDPKGVMLPHRCFLHLCRAIRASLPVGETDRFLSFLPLSHVYERMAGHVLPIFLGGSIAYSRSLASLAEDMRRAQPTIMLCVPRFLESMHARIMDSVQKQGGLKSKLFHIALSQGLAKHQGKAAPLYGVLDKIALSKLRERTGGRLRFFVSGGAALPSHVGEFYVASGLNVLQGYGLTETCAFTCVNHPDRNDPSTVGEPAVGVEIRIAADGEILVRGPSVMDGYLNLPAASAEAIDADGWFHTGDIGEFVGKKLKITDRKKDLLVLANGKNVAPQPIENRLKQSPWIAEAVVLGDGMEHPCALIVPDLEAIAAHAGRLGLAITDRAQLVLLPEVRDLIKKEVGTVNKDLASFERVMRFEILDRAFSVDGGELTPTLKVKRRVIERKYEDTIKKMRRN